MLFMGQYQEWSQRKGSQYVILQNSIGLQKWISKNGGNSYPKESFELNIREENGNLLELMYKIQWIFLSFLIVLFYLVVSRGFYFWIYRQLVGLLGRVIGLYLHTGQHNTEKHRHKSMPRARFEPAISTFERPTTVLASDRSVIEIVLYLNVDVTRHES